MAISRSKKKEILDKLTDAVKTPALVFVSFRGLPVKTATELRRALAEQGAKYLVVKKTLLGRALAGSKIGGAAPALPGEIALAYLPDGKAGGDDTLIVAKGVYQFEQKTQGQVKIVGGVYEGGYAAAGLMVSLAQIPAREVLLGQLVNLINSPIAGLVMALDAIAEKSAPGGSVAVGQEV